MGDSQRNEDEEPSDRTDKASEGACESSPSAEEDERDNAEKATDPDGDIASGGGEQPV
jgi:hypothetical protein